MKDKLVFDVTDVNTIADSDSVGAFVRSSDGTLITHHAVGTGTAKHLDVYAALADGAGTALTSTAITEDIQALDVNITNSLDINTQIDGVYDDPDNLVPDSAGVIFHTRADSITIAQQVERTTAGTLAAILAENLDQIKAIDTNSFLYAINDDSGDAELLTLDGTSGGLNVHLIGSDITIETSDAALANASVVSKADSLAAAGTAEKVVGTNLADRKYLFVYNNYTRKIFIGGSDVDKDNGFPISPGSYIELRAGASVDVYYDSEASGATIRTLELS